MSHLNQEIIKRESIDALVTAYRNSCDLIDAAFEKIDQASKIMQTTYGENFSSFNISMNLRYCQTANDLKKYLKKDSWKCILDRIEIKKFMSNKDINQMENSFDNNSEIPEITYETVWEILNGILNTTSEYRNKMLLEAFNILTPGLREYEKYKTNKSNSKKGIGKKVIFSGQYLTMFFGNLWHVNHEVYEKNLLAVDKAFHLLDGKGMPKGYICPLVDTINLTPLSKTNGETEYFEFKCYKNGNLHLIMKRMDLVEEFNKIIGDGTKLSE